MVARAGRLVGGEGEENPSVWSLMLCFIGKGHSMCPWLLGLRELGCPAGSSDTHHFFQVQTGPVSLVVADMVKDEQ